MSRDLVDYHHGLSHQLRVVARQFIPTVSSPSLLRELSYLSFVDRGHHCERTLSCFARAAAYGVFTL